MSSGFSLIVAGSAFDPEAYLCSSPLPELPWKVVLPSTEHPDRTPAVELYDIHPGAFSLDLATELDDFLTDYEAELGLALSANGVEFRNLNIYDVPNNSFVEFSFSNAQLRAIVDLGFEVSMTLIEGQAWTAGSRILRRL